MDAACLLQLLCRQLREDTEDESYHEQDVNAKNEQHDTSDEDLAPWDSHVRDNQDQERLQPTQSKLRKRFLHRLAEVLARVKGAPGEVAIAYMVELKITMATNELRHGSRIMKDFPEVIWITYATLVLI